MRKRHIPENEYEAMKLALRELTSLLRFTPEEYESLPDCWNVSVSQLEAYKYIFQSHDEIIYLEKADGPDDGYVYCKANHYSQWQLNIVSDRKTGVRKIASNIRRYLDEKAGRVEKLLADFDRLQQEHPDVKLTRPDFVAMLEKNASGGA